MIRDNRSITGDGAVAGEYDNEHNHTASERTISSEGEETEMLKARQQQIEWWARKVREQAEEYRSVLSDSHDDSVISEHLRHIVESAKAISKRLK